MTWKDIGKAIGKAAPVLGSVVGGPAGGAIGAAISALLGVENKPDKVAEALKTNPEAFVKLKQYEMQHQEELQKLQLEAMRMRLQKDSKDLDTINATIRAELAQQDNYTKRWRPTMGYAVTFSWVITWVAVVYTIVFNPAYAQRVILALTQTTALWGIALSVLGVYVWKRSKDKEVISGLSNEQNMVGVVNKIKSKISPAKEEVMDAS